MFTYLNEGKARVLSLLRLSLVFIAVAMLSSVTSGSVVSFDLGDVFNPEAPAGDPPWLRAIFDDTGQPADTVLLTLSDISLTGTEFVTQWYFNLDPEFDPLALQFSDPCKTGSFDDPGISLGTDQFKADGDGKFDIFFAFATADGAPTRFTAGDAAEYTITYSGEGSLTADSFDFLSEPPDSGYPTMAKVQGIGPSGDDSGWVTLPEPATVLLLALGLGISRHRRLA